MKDLQVSILDYNNETDLLDYEKGLFESFSSNEWFAENYLIYGDRMKPFIPYDNILTYIIKHDGGILAALSVNIGLTECCIIEKRGYDLSNYKDKTGAIEGLTLFLRDTKLNRFELGSLITNRVFSDLKERGYTFLYDSMEKRVSRLYTKLYGFELLDTFNVGSVEYALLEKKL